MERETADAEVSEFGNPSFFDLSDGLLHKNGLTPRTLLTFRLPFLFAMTRLVVNDCELKVMVVYDF